MSGTPFPLKPGLYSLEIKLDGHAPATVSLSAQDFQVGRYPPTGALTLNPDTTLQAIRDRWTSLRWLGLGLVIAAAGAAYAGKSFLRLRDRQQKLEVFTSSSSESKQRSLIMEQVGPYRVVRPLGKGGMAEVYLAIPNQSLDLTEAVAIKVLNQEMRERPDFEQRFVREITVSSELTHPGIVEVRHWGHHGNRMYLAMELVDGKELRHLLPELRDDWSRTRDILSQLFTAIDYAHQRGVAHRDLKPENVMVTKTGRVKVMDFGLARAVDSSTLTQAGSAMGTPRYIAPESISGQGADDRADQYSLGIMAYEMLVGRTPFDSDEVLYLLYSHATLDPEAPSSQAALPTAVDEVLLKMLKKNPHQRFRTVEEARVALLAATESLL